MKKIYLFFVLAFVPMLSMCSGPMMGSRNCAENYGCSFGFGYGGMFMWILFLILLGVVIYFIILSTKSKNFDGQSGETPIDILKKRYAKGEITKEDFDRMKNELQ